MVENLAIIIVGIIIITMTAVTVFFLLPKKKVVGTEDTGSTKEDETKKTIAEKVTWRGYAKAHPWKTVKWIAGILLLLLLLSWVLPWLVSERTTESRQGSTSTTQVLPQGKSVGGGPLRWNKEANVKVRPRMNRGSMDEKNSCFVGIIPPGSWVDPEFVAYHESKIPWKVVLLDYGYTGKFLSPFEMDQQAISRSDVAAGVLELKDLPRKGRHAKRITDRSTSSSGTGFKVAELYLQSSPGGPEEIIIDLKKEPPGTFQYLVEVGAEDTLLALPTPPWKYLWIAPVHHKDYQASWKSKPLPATGINMEGEEGTFAIEVISNGETKVLDHPFLLQAEDILGQKVKLRLKIPEGVSPTEVKGDKDLKPAKIIVGIQM